MNSLHEQLQSIGTHWRTATAAPIQTTRTQVLLRIERGRRLLHTLFISVALVAGIGITAAILQQPTTVSVTHRPQPVSTAATPQQHAPIARPTAGAYVQPPSVILTETEPSPQDRTAISVSNPSFLAEYNRLMDMARSAHTTNPAYARNLYRAAIELSQQIGATEEAEAARTHLQELEGADR